ncbi:MAG: hypothetical protein LUQ32_03515 [Methanomicrobiales archaeon]|nr:hypothetical protein [Methanomicrobiales archaeon]
MKGTGKILVAGLVLSAVLLAGMAATQEGSISFGQHGDIVTISGQTNLAVGDTLLITVISAGFTPTEKGTGGGFAGAGGTIIVQQGSPLNTYTFDVNVSAFPPGLYLVTVESVETGFMDSAQFTLPLVTASTGTPVITATETVTPEPVSTSPQTTAPAPGTMPSATPVMEITSMAGILIAARFLLRR